MALDIPLIEQNLQRAFCLPGDKQTFELDLIGLQLTDDDVPVICDFLNTRPDITHLCLTSNSIGDNGAILLAANTTLATLYVVDNNIGDNGAIALAANKTLSALYLRLNKISDVGGEALLNNIYIGTIDIIEGNLLSDALKERFFNRRVEPARPASYVNATTVTEERNDIDMNATTDAEKTNTIGMMVLGGFIAAIGIAAVALAFTALNLTMLGTAGLVAAGIFTALAGCGLFANGYRNQPSTNNGTIELNQDNANSRP